MNLSRSKPAKSGSVSKSDSAGTKSERKSKKTIPRLEEFIKSRDYVGAITLLEFGRSSGRDKVEECQWMAYCNFHNGNYQKALQEYEALAGRGGVDQDGNLSNLACCYFMLGMYNEANDAIEKGSRDFSILLNLAIEELEVPDSCLKNRLLFHLSYKLNDEKKLMTYHQKLKNVIEDQLSLAAIHYLRTHYQEAIDIYKKVLMENREMVALNVYLAMCYHKLDYYDVSQEVLASYVHSNPDSAIAINLKACNYYKLYNGKAAEAELKVLMDMASSSFTFARDLLKHNLVIFRGGEGALQIFPQLIDVIPEAKLNLAIYYLRTGSYEEGYTLIQDLEPNTPQEYILKAVANTLVGQERGSRENLDLAQQLFQLVGTSASECDTIPGRQCMASCFFLMRQFEDVLTYLNSVKSYFFNADPFNFNYAQAKAAIGNFQEAEEIFLLINSEQYKSDPIYINWLARCHIMNGKPQLAWELYLKMETSADSFHLLQLIANDCYRMGQFIYSAKAFDIMEKLDPSPEYWEGKRGACVGVFQMVIAGHEPKEMLSEVLQILRNTSQPQAELIMQCIRKWMRDNRVSLPGL